MVESNPDLARAIGASGGAILDSYFATTLAISAVVGTGFGVSSALRFRSEETAGRAEPLLATGMSRTRLALGFLVVTVAGTLFQLAAMGLAAGLTYAVVTGDGSAVGPLVGAALALSPGCLAVLRGGRAPDRLVAARDPGGVGGARARLPAGLPRRAAPNAGLAVGGVAVVAPPDDSRWSPSRRPSALGVLAVAVGLAAAGVAGLRRRDIG